MYKHLAYMYVCISCVFMVSAESRRGYWIPWNLLQMVVSCRVGAGNHIWVLWQSSSSLYCWANSPTSNTIISIYYLGLVLLLRFHEPPEMGWNYFSQTYFVECLVFKIFYFISLSFRLCGHVHVWRSDTIFPVLLSTMGVLGSTQAVRLGSTCLYVLRHLTSPRYFLYAGNYLCLKDYLV